MTYIFHSATRAKLQYKLKQKKHLTETKLEEMLGINYDEV